MFEPEPWHPARPGVFRPSRLDPSGVRGPTRSQSQRSSVRRTSHGFYLPASVERTVAQRIVEASMVRTGRQLVVTGWGNLAWRGSRWFNGNGPDGQELPVQVLANTRDLRPRPGAFYSGEGISSHLREVVDGLLLADVRAAVSFLMRYARSESEAVRVVDMAAYDDLVSVAEMTDFLATQSSWTGIPQARNALPRCSESAWSPVEVDMREVWVMLARRPTPLANAPVFDVATGRHVATPDLIDPVAGVAGEYEGAVHLSREVRARDVVREGLLRRHHLEVVTMLADDRRDPGAFIARLHDAYARAARNPSVRTWTVEPPSWWVPTQTVAQRRALSPEQRARFLRYRAS